MSAIVSTPRSDAIQARILIVDDHQIVRQGYELLLEAEPGFQIIGGTGDVTEATRLCFELHPDLAIVDISLRNGHGLELCKQIRAWNEQGVRSTKTLVVSAHDEDLYAERALHAGASGYLNKGETSDNLRTAIRRVLAGKVFVSPAITDRLLNRLSHGQDEPAHSPVDKLSDRELEVFELIGQGLTTRQVAENLDLSPKTVETYRENLKVKLKVSNANQLVRAAVQFVLQDV